MCLGTLNNIPMLEFYYRLGKAIDSAPDIRRDAASPGFQIKRHESRETKACPSIGLFPAEGISTSENDKWYRQNKCYKLSSTKNKSGK
jgi:hypothetical protein